MIRLTAVADGVWGAETEQSIGLGACLPLRMTVLQADGGLVLISPIRIDDELGMQLDRLGKVHTLIGPNLLHYKYLAQAKQRYPAAKLLGAPGLAEKKPEIPFDGAIQPELFEELDVLLVRGAKKLSEVVFLHKPSRTLVVTDLVFNIPDASGMSWLVLNALSRALGRCEQSRLCRLLTNDRSETARSIETLLSWSFDRVVPAHGEVVEDDAASRLKAGLWWMRGLPGRDALA